MTDAPELQRNYIAGQLRKIHKTTHASTCSVIRNAANPRRNSRLPGEYASALSKALSNFRFDSAESPCPRTAIYKYLTWRSRFAPEFKPIIFDKLKRLSCNLFFFSNILQVFLYVKWSVILEPFVSVIVYTLHYTHEYFCWKTSYEHTCVGEIGEFYHNWNNRFFFDNSHCFVKIFAGCRIIDFEQYRKDQILSLFDRYQFPITRTHRSIPPNKLLDQYIM